MEAQNKFGIDESKQTIEQLVKLEAMIIKNIADGFTVVDALTIGLEAFPKIQEWIRDWALMKPELGDLQPIESVGLYNAASSAVTPEEREKSFLIPVFRLLAQTHVYAADTVNRGKELFELAQDVVRKK